MTSTVDLTGAFGSVLDHYRKREWGEAAGMLEEILRAQPDHADALHLLGLVAQQVGRYDSAVHLIESAIRQRPSEARFYNNCGEAYRKKGETAAAVARFRRALALDAGYVEAYNNLGNAFLDQNRIEPAIGCYQQARGIDPGNADARWNLSLALLLSGNFKEGWKNYECRWDASQTKSRRCFLQPRWDGGDLTGRTILLYREQGHGDVLQFIRYATFVAGRGGRVIVECGHELQRIIGTAMGVSCVVTGEPFPPFDVQLPILSLPATFGTTAESIPSEVPYLRSDPILTERWRAKLCGGSGQFRIGLVWAGSRRHQNDRNRSFLLRSLAPLASVPGVTFYSLQKGEAAAQAAEGISGTPIIDFSEELGDFADTAALLSNLDLIITADTAVAHLAGALARPVWTLIPFAPDWRWMLGRSDSPWYPTMRLFRQPRPGAWEPVVAAVTDELQKLTHR